MGVIVASLFSATEDESDADVDNEENETDTETPQPPTRKPLDLSKLEEAIMSINRPGVSVFFCVVWNSLNNFVGRIIWDLGIRGRISRLLRHRLMDTTRQCFTPLLCRILATRILRITRDIINPLLLPVLLRIRHTTVGADIGRLRLQ